jgi:anti-sigma regulatory factor (Ser/Thr protein kinase)/ActR/RegA family two-component response regulator
MIDGQEQERFRVSVQKAIVIGRDVQVKRMLEQVLDDRGWMIENAADNSAALALVEASKYDLVITCETTSGQEDIQLLRAIRRVHPHTRVVILTSTSDSAAVISAIREHAFGYFSSPYSIESLASVVEHAIEEPCLDDGIEILSATPQWIRLLVRCDLNAAERLLHFFSELIDLPEPENEAVATAFRELLMNAIEHGGELDPEKCVEISYLRTRRAVACKIRDPGVGFSMQEIPHSALLNPPDDPLRHMTYREAHNLRPGGFGVLLARNSVDELLYNEHGNEVVLVKYLDPVKDAT